MYAAVARYVLALFLKVHTADILDNDTVKVHINPTQVLFTGCSKVF